MLAVVLQRALQAIPVLFGVSLVTFAILYMLPGDPAGAMLAGSGASAETIAQLRAHFGLDKPPHLQYLHFLGRLLRGDFGHSIHYDRPALALLVDALPHTLELTLAALLLALAIGFPLGLAAATAPGSWRDHLCLMVSLIGVSFPPFWIGLLAIFLFSFTLGWLPAIGVGGISYLILPGIVLSLSVLAVIARLTRAAVQEALAHDYVVTARGKGLSQRRVVGVHVLRNAVLPLITVVGLQTGWLLSGAVIVEIVFARPGLGRLLVEAILNQDFPVVQASVLLLVLAYLGINLGVDILHALADPRIRRGEGFVL